MAVTLTTNVTAPTADQSGPNIKSSDYLAMTDYWQMIRTILAGTKAMRDAGELYLPRLQNEKMTVDPDGKRYDPYELRRRQAPFTNIYDDVSKSLASKPFSKELVMKQGTPPVFVKLADDIDGQGNNLHVFASQVFRAGMDFAITWILVDYTRAQPRSDGAPLSVADEQDQGLRPYWVHIPPDRLLAVYSDFIGGKEIVTHARIYEPTRVLSGFVERLVERVRVLDRQPIAWDVAGKPSDYGPATWEVWEMVIDASTNTGAWVVVDAGPFTVGVIPLVRFATGERLGVSFQYSPPLRTVAYMQIDEFQDESNLQNIMQMTCFPMITGVGIPEPADGASRNLAVGPRTILYGGLTPDGQPGHYAYLEPAANSVKIIADRLEKKQTDMRDLGMQPLT